MSTAFFRTHRRRIRQRADDISLLIKDLADGDAVVRETARRALVANGRPAEPALVEALSDPHRQVRWEAAKALDCLRDPAAAPALSVALGDKDHGVRWLAAEALIDLGWDGLEPLLKALFHPGNAFWCREGAHHVIHELMKKESAGWLLPVLEALNAPDPGVMVPPAALRALKAMKASR